MPLDQKEFDSQPIDISPEGLLIRDRERQPLERGPMQETSVIERGSGFEQSVKVEGVASSRIQPVAGIPTSAYIPIADESYQKYKQIERVLEEDLGEIYNNLTPQEQKIFKIKGEETARSIFQLVYHQTKIKVKKIIKLIRNWLKIIPGINRFFLEQEAKIKADKIVSLADESKKIKF